MTTTTSTGRTGHEPDTARRLRRIGVAASAAVAVATIGIVVADNHHEQPREPAPSAVDRQWAADLAAIIEMARTHGLTGLSPASLRPVSRDLRVEASRTVAEHGNIRAIEHRDEAAVRRATDRELSAERAVQAAIAAFAVAEGLTGLSPASLHPISD